MLMLLCMSSRKIADSTGAIDIWKDNFHIFWNILFQIFLHNDWSNSQNELFWRNWCDKPHNVTNKQNIFRMYISAQNLNDSYTFLATYLILIWS